MIVGESFNGSGNPIDYALDPDQEVRIPAKRQDQNIEEGSLNMIPREKSAAETVLRTHLSAPLPLRIHKSFQSPGDLSSPTISGKELLSLEGRPSMEEGQIVTASRIISPSRKPFGFEQPGLRHKPKFGPDAKVKLRTNRDCASSTTTPHSQVAEHESYLKYEMPASPSSYEYTQRFQQQLSLLTHRSEPPSMDVPQWGQHGNPFMEEKATSQEWFPEPKKNVSEQQSPGYVFHHRQSTNCRRQRSQPTPIHVQDSFFTPTAYGSSQQPPQPPMDCDGTVSQHRHAHSWHPVPAHFNGGHTISMGQIQSHNLADDMPVTSPTYSATSPAYHDTSFLFHGIPPFPASDCHEIPAGYPQADLPASNYAPALPLPAIEDTFPNLPPMDDGLTNILDHVESHTPPPSPTKRSTSPPQPEAAISQKQSRSSRARNGGPLHHRRTSANLKPARSRSSIKLSRSAVQLRGKKSIGQGLNHTGIKSPTIKKQSQEMNFGFMNFTPEDSKKILGGVAPSGSSKTKARREHEASEERRRMSLAALKAIEVAGGDTEALKQQFKVEVEDDVPSEGSWHRTRGLDSAD